MKKILSLLLASAMMFTLTACNSGETPEQAVAAGLDAFKVMDMEKISTYYEDTTDLPTENTFSDEEKAQYDLIMQHLSYTVKDSKTEKDTATVTVDIVNLDMSEVMNQYMTKVMEMAFSEATKPAEEQMSEEELAKTVEQTLYDIMGSDEAPTKTYTVSITLHKKDKSWQIVADDALFTALTGGLMDAMAEMQNLLQ